MGKIKNWESFNEDFHSFNSEFAEKEFQDVDISDRKKTMEMIGYQKKHGGLIRIPESQAKFFEEQGYEVKRVNVSDFEKTDKSGWNQYLRDAAVLDGIINYVIVIVDDTKAELVDVKKLEEN